MLPCQCRSLVLLRMLWITCLSINLMLSQVFLTINHSILVGFKVQNFQCGPSLRSPLSSIRTPDWKAGARINPIPRGCKSTSSFGKVKFKTSCCSFLFQKGITSSLHACPSSRSAVERRSSPSIGIHVPQAQKVPPRRRIRRKYRKKGLALLLMFETQLSFSTKCKGISNVRNRNCWRWINRLSTVETIRTVLHHTCRSCVPFQFLDRTSVNSHQEEETRNNTGLPFFDMQKAW